MRIPPTALGQIPRGKKKTPSSTALMCRPGTGKWRWGLSKDKRHPPQKPWPSSQCHTHSGPHRNDAVFPATVGGLRDVVLLRPTQRQGGWPRWPAWQRRRSGVKPSAVFQRERQPENPPICGSARNWRRGRTLPFLPLAVFQLEPAPWKDYCARR